MFWKIILILGILGTLSGLLVTIISVTLVPLTNGRTSWDEAIFGIIPGVIVLIISFFITVLGLVFVMKNRKKLARI